MNLHYLLLLLPIVLSMAVPKPVIDSSADFSLSLDAQIDDVVANDPQLVAVAAAPGLIQPFDLGPAAGAASSWDTSQAQVSAQLPSNIGLQGGSFESAGNVNDPAPVDHVEPHDLCCTKQDSSSDSPRLLCQESKWFPRPPPLSN